MARPERNNVDYFPFYCDDGKKMFYLEENYGNDGFATFLKLLRELAKTDYHFLDLSKNTTMMFLSAKCKVSKDILINIIGDLVDLEKFDRMLWEENKIIWCQDFIDSIQDAYKKRLNKCIDYDGLLSLLSSLGVRKLSLIPTIEPINTQRKENYTIVEEIKEKQNEKIFGDAEKDELIDSLIIFYGFEENRFYPQKKLILAFVNTLFSKNENENFAREFKNYHEYKKLSQEKIHGFESFLGSQSERFEDGAWRKENWEQKLLNFIEKQPKSKFQKVADNHNTPNPYKT